MLQFERLKNKAGIFFVLFALIIIVVSAFAYRTLLSPRWVREFSLDVAARAEIVSYSPNTTAFPTIRDRVEPNSPYICLQKFIEFKWDSVYFVSNREHLPGQLRAKPWLKGSYEKLYGFLSRDPRYQFIIFELDGVVIDYEHYFSMWADLSGLSRMSGYLPSESVFLAESDGLRYTLKLVSNLNGNYCKD